METRAGTGHKLTPVEIAARLERMQQGRQGKVLNSAARAAQLAADCTGLSLDELRQRMAPRRWMIGIYHVGGYSYRQIATMLGYAGPDPVMRALRSPEVKRLVDLIQQAQLKRVLEGEFGVQAQAKAAAPKVMRRVIEKAGGIEGPDGTLDGMAKKDADALRAADLVLTVSGDKVERRENLHAHLFRELSDDELASFAERGELPAKYRDVGKTLGLIEGD